MDQTASSPSFFNTSLLSRVRRNHALEHATMHILGRTHRNLRLVGNASFDGFYVYGAIPTENLRAAAEQGLQALKNGQAQMAIHPNCGSNLVVAGLLTGLGVFLTMGGLAKKPPKGFLARLSYLPLAITTAIAGIFLAKPLGTMVQAHITTDAQVGDMQIVGIIQDTLFGIPRHHIRTEG